MKLKTILVSIGLGAGLMYFYDPQHGERRRTMVRDRANKLVNDFDDSIDMAVRDARNRARGVLSEMTAKLSDEGGRPVQQRLDRSENGALQLNDVHYPRSQTRAGIIYFWKIGEFNTFRYPGFYSFFAA